MSLLEILSCAWFIICCMGQALMAGLFLCMVIGICIEAFDFVADRLGKKS